ncbi:MAG: MoxR family ATPase [Planctomycetota bacterium]
MNPATPVRDTTDRGTSNESPPTRTTDSIIAALDAVREQMAGVIRGKEGVIDRIVMAMLCQGHVLLEDVPGVGKTTLAKALAGTVGLSFGRVQCTPDLLPSDIVGFNIFQPADGTFAFKRGPVFHHLLLVDEINRASPRTQSALLEAMAERQVTIEGAAYPLPQPFVVLATQNPIGFEGTFPLPEAQLDRFLFLLRMDYPDRESEIDLLLDQAVTDATSGLESVMDGDMVQQAAEMVRRVHVERLIAQYVVDIVAATRDHPAIRLGSSPRGAQMILRAAQAAAFLDRRAFVLPDDVQSVAADVLAHRIVRHESLRESVSSWDNDHALLRELISAVKLP